MAGRYVNWPVTGGAPDRRISIGARIRTLGVVLRLLCTLLWRGAKPLEAPADRSYGVRSACVKGPGALTFEIEQPLRKRR